MDYLIVIQALWIVIPVYVSNASAVIVGGGTPIDFGKKWKDGKRILGDGKTWRGLISGTFLGMTSGFGLVVASIYINSRYDFLNLNNFERFPLMIPIIFSLCFGALLGDIIESFFKRRIGKDRGENWILFDQLDFILGALFLSFLVSTLLEALGYTKENWFIENLVPWHALVIIVITPFFHLLANFVHKKLNTRKTLRG